MVFLSVSPSQACSTVPSFCLSEMRTSLPGETRGVLVLEKNSWRNEQTKGGQGDVVVVPVAIAFYVLGNLYIHIYIYYYILFTRVARSTLYRLTVLNLGTERRSPDRIEEVATMSGCEIGARRMGSSPVERIARVFPAEPARRRATGF